ncbi:MAG: 50S ribosomal protein L2 [Parcubacteria group bacterium GW2011_GWA2_47_12]|nr:MAG: 50S ribosomal protein L2 [Parcubacteria group bacterium GW2011_GWA2_47_12]
MKIYKPTTPSRQHMTGIDYRKLLSGHRPHKKLVFGGKRSVGRNAFGRITVRHKGGGHKRLFRDVDFVYDKRDIPARIAYVEYDPNRTGFIGLAVYADGEKRYVLLPQSVKAGDSFIVSERAEMKPANRLPIGKIPVGAFVYNISFRPDGAAALARSAGNYAEVVGQDAGYTLLKLPSTEIRKVLSTAWACIGAVSNEENYLVHIGKAGRSRWLGIRPTVRGSAMNPVDHPKGGGEGKQPRGRRREINVYGKPTGKGQKTRRPKKYSNVFIVSRRKVGKSRTSSAQ